MGKLFKTLCYLGVIYFGLHFMLAKTSAGFVILQQASGLNNPIIVEGLVVLGAKVNQTNEDGLTPLHAAAFEGGDQAIEMLIKRNAEVDAVDSTGRTPLHYAAYRGHDLAVQALLQHGANPRAIESTQYMTPLHLAAQSGTRGTAQLLVKHGALVNARAKGGITPRYIAKKEKNGDVYNFLGEKGGKLK